MFIDVVKDFRADPTGTKDSLGAFCKAVAAVGSRGRHFIVLQPGQYLLSGTWVIDSPVTVMGAGRRAATGSTLIVPKGRDGVRVIYQGPTPGGGAGSTLESFRVIPAGGTTAWAPGTRGYVAEASAVVPSTGYAGWSYLCIKSGASGAVEPEWPTLEGAVVDDPSGTCAWKATYVAGVKLLGGAMLRNLSAEGFGGDGFSVFASTGDGNNANSWQMQSCSASGNAGWGFFTQGADSNGGLALNCVSMQNGLGGFQDNSFLGNTYVACLAEANRRYAYFVDAEQASNMSVFFNCYAEAGQLVRLYAKTMWFGGIQDRSAAAYGTGNVINNGASNSLYFINDTRVDGTGDSASIQIGRVGGSAETPLSLGFSKNVGGIHMPIAFGYGVVNGAGSTGWVGWNENSRTSWAMSIGNAPEGGGNFWIPNDCFRGPAETLRSRHVTRSIGPPRGEAFATSDFCNELSLQETGACAFSCVEAGTPGRWGIVQPRATRGITDDFLASARDCYIGVTRLDKDLTVTLPGTPTLAEGFEMLVKDESGTAGAPHRIHVQPVTGERLDGGSGADIATRFGSLRVIRRQGAWWTA